MVRQCELLGLARSSYYYEPVPTSEEDLQLMRLLDEQYTRTPFYGKRKMVVFLAEQGYAVDRKRVRRLMQLMGLETIAPFASSKSERRAKCALSVPLAWHEHHSDEPGLELRYHVHTLGARICLVFRRLSIGGVALSWPGS